MVGGVPDVITCAKFQIEIFMGYDFTGGRIFDFCIDFSMGLTTCAACEKVSLVKLLTELVDEKSVELFVCVTKKIS